jgi:hypothetical protein
VRPWPLTACDQQQRILQVDNDQDTEGSMSTAQQLLAAAVLLPSVSGSFLTCGMPILDSEL